MAAIRNVTFIAAAWLVVGVLIPVAAFAAPAVSNCLAIANAAPMIIPASVKLAALKKRELRLTFVGHSTFLIESAGGIRIATDYAGWAGAGLIPDVVTMNHAHDTHYTDFPDPNIKHVLRGWNPKGGYAAYNLQLADVLIRNVPTNIRSFSGDGTELFGNSIFIFELAGLCIGHLGHLHHELTDQQLGQIGQLDVVLVPADGIWTMDHGGMAKVILQLRPRLVVPMHYFDASTLSPFIDRLKPLFSVKINPVPTVVLSRATLPEQPQVLILPGF